MEKVASKDSTSIAFDRTGNGPPVVLVLGALNSRKTGAKLAKMLSSRFTAVSYDRRGRGNSKDESPYSVNKEVDDLAAVVDALGEPVFLYGHSSGGALALEAALALKSRVRKVAVYEVPFSTEPHESDAARSYVASLRSLLADDRRDDAVELFIRSVGVSAKQIEALKRLPMWKGLTRLAPTLRYDAEVLGDGYEVPTGRLAKVARPTLVMHGEAGTASMAAAARAIAASVPKARLLALPGQGHGVSPKALAPLLEEFFLA